MTAWAALAENLPSGSSYRPGRRASGTTARTAKPGKTTHVLNTDAEGRLVLADAIVRAAEEEPDYLLETSTLTGAQVVALGNRTMAVMGSEELRDRVAELAREVGEGGWAMPLPDELRESIDSPHCRPAEHQLGSGGRDAGRRPLSEHLRARRSARGPTWTSPDRPSTPESPTATTHPAAPASPSAPCSPSSPTSPAERPRVHPPGDHAPATHPPAGINFHRRGKSCPFGTGGTEMDNFVPAGEVDPRRGDGRVGG